ncbi:YbcC family protein [Hydrogenophaga sp.]|uniref:YbcC family protein n=1 Tax=Hydrogenophaga sp. TaxID=1904254 RepID=UPI00262EDB18|nr:DUF2309 domain-containing protein [Hydrogenophaga sp.]MDM7951438.1 DUF2309 domain-containing protein [Hydrogenophaga sp.]
MNAPVDLPLNTISVSNAIAQACDRIAPTWPLDQFIAVNPYWGWLSSPAPQAAAALGALAGTRLTHSRADFKRYWAAGHLTVDHLHAAITRQGSQATADELIRAMQSPEPSLRALPLLTERMQSLLPASPLPWRDLVTQQISQHCAAFFDAGQARWGMDRRAGLLATWQRQIAADRGLPWHQAHRDAAVHIRALPSNPLALITHALDALEVPASAHVHYLSALLLSINGWAAWCAFERWQARLGGRDDDQIVHLLAIRLAWELLLRDDAAVAGVPAPTGDGWVKQWAHADAEIARHHAEQSTDWLLQTALEIAYQQPLSDGLLAALQRPAPAAPKPEVQAVFCIDVRSEVFRRALESASPGIDTRGFAGFFGLPIAYRPAGSALTRPQLPGLLAPAITVSEHLTEEKGLGQALTERRQGALAWRQRWADLRAAAASGFSFVETCGLAYGPKLLKDTLPSEGQPARWEDAGLDTTESAHRPRLPQACTDPAAAASLAAGILNAMGIVKDFAPLVMLVGHGSQTTNNPHAASLDCGACGGQTGEVNARALADLLNTPAVRAELAALGVFIPEATHFLPALHNTTTDEVQLFDTDAVPPGLHNALAALRTALQTAGQRARAERAPALGLAHLAGDAPGLERSLRERANDWAQVRPEWGLADNAAFIVAPRARTKGMNLGGRSFLHDYDWRQDKGFGVLTLIMTAPMVVTNWINLQYHASALDQRRYGSGNKLLHNVVGARLGVFEGNGGDLRIGLPLQSLHDGDRLRHTPLRLSVFIEAPRAAIDAIIEQHAVVRDLVGNGWLHLFRLDGEQPAVERRAGGGWQAVH